MEVNTVRNYSEAPVSSARNLLYASATKAFIAATFGYSLYYVCRLSLSVVKSPLVQEGLLTEFQLGIIGSALFYSYAVGKLVNGFLADRVNIRKFASAGLLISAAVNLILGFQTGFLLFFCLWLLNGWVQSMGAPCFIIGLTRWFSSERRGTVYGLWSASHNIGEGLTFVLTAIVVANFGWRYGWWLSGTLGVVGTLLIWCFFKSNPAITDKSVSDPDIQKEIKNTAQLSLLKNPTLWLIALASMFMYVTRYSINSWGIFFLEKARGYSIEQASLVISVGSIFGVVGTVASGWISDRFFRGERAIPTILAGAMNTGAISLFLFFPNSLAISILSMVIFGISIGTLISFLGGLMAVDIAGKNATGAALGIVGMASYAGAGTQDIISGYLIGAFKTATTGGEVNYNFMPMAMFWIAAASLSTLASFLAWRTLKAKINASALIPTK